MTTFHEARRLILDSVFPLGIERIGLLDSLGRVVAEEIVAPWDMPLCDNSAMDGFAVRSADASPGAVLAVTGFIPAGGDPVPPVDPGCAVKIMTGAPVPPGCDTVVPVEETSESGGRVTILEPVRPGQHIRFRGEDIAAGEAAIPAGRLIRPPEVSLLASLGKPFVPVFRQPRVAILSTGDELIEPGEELAPGKIINSNAFSLAAAVRDCGGLPVILGIARDNVADHEKKIREGLAADVLITSAGVSAGDRDFVRDVLAGLGVRQVFWKVAMKPGGPTAFALYGEKPVFSLPGNPVSTIVTFDELVRPALLKMLGRRRVLRPLVPIVLTEDIRKKKGKLQFVRLRIERRDGAWYGRSSGDQNTGILRTMLLADAMAMLPADRDVFTAGEEVEAHLLGGDAEMLEA